MSPTTGTPSPASSAMLGAGGEALDPVVRRMHLEHEAGLAGRSRPRSRPRSSGWSCRPRGSGARATQQVGQPEAVPDLDQLAPADHDLPPGGQRGRGEHERGRVVVHHVHGLGVGHGPGQRVEHRRAPRPRVPEARSNSRSVEPAAACTAAWRLPTAAPGRGWCAAAPRSRSAPGSGVAASGGRRPRPRQEPAAAAMKPARPCSLSAAHGA